MFNTSAVGKEEPGQVPTLQDKRNYPSFRVTKSLSFRIFSLLSHHLDFPSHEKFDLLSQTTHKFDSFNKFDSLSQL